MIRKWLNLDELNNKSMYIDKLISAKLIKIALHDTKLFERFISLIDNKSVQLFFL